MSGFIDPYSLGLIISLVGVLLVQVIHEEDVKPATQVTQSYEDVEFDHEMQVENSLKKNDTGWEYDI